MSRLSRPETNSNYVANAELQGQGRITGGAAVVPCCIQVITKSLGSGIRPDDLLAVAPWNNNNNSMATFDIVVTSANNVGPVLAS